VIAINLSDVFTKMVAKATATTCAACKVGDEAGALCPHFEAFRAIGANGPVVVVGCKNYLRRQGIVGRAITPIKDARRGLVGGHFTKD
jgi:hypothetical protein